MYNIEQLEHISYSSASGTYEIYKDMCETVSHFLDRRWKEGEVVGDMP